MGSRLLFKSAGHHHLSLCGGFAPNEAFQKFRGTARKFRGNLHVFGPFRPFFGKNFKHPSADQKLNAYTFRLNEKTKQQHSRNSCTSGWSVEIELGPMRPTLAPSANPGSFRTKNSSANSSKTHRARLLATHLLLSRAHARAGGSKQQQV